MFLHFVELDLVQHDMAFHQALRDVDDSLVGGAAELEFERLLRHDERAVDEDVGEREEFEHLRTFLREFLQAFEGIAREDYQVETAFLDFARERNEGRGLVHRVAAAERDAVEQRVLLDHLEDFFPINKMTPVEVVGLRVLTPGAMMMAALGKDGHADTGTVHERFGLDAGNPQARVFVHVIRRA